MTRGVGPDPTTDPLEPVDHVLREVFRGVTGAEESLRVRRGMWLHATLPRPPVGTTPHQIIHRQDKLVVRHYPAAGEEKLPPVVVVPSLINRAYICDLEPDRSLVGGLAKLGHPVYLVDWGVPGAEDSDEDVAYVLLRLLHRSVFRACHHAGSKDAFLLGYCQGGTLAAMYTALRPERVRGLACLTTPVDFSKGGRFTQFAQAASPEALRGPDGLVDVDVMSMAFKLLDPMGNWHKYTALEAAAADPRRLARTLARERWLEENVPLPGAFAEEFIRYGYQEDRLLRGTWPVGGETVDLARIRCPVLVCPAERDFIAPPEACTPLADTVSSADVTVELLTSGHIGCVVGGFGPKVFYPLLDRWFRARRG